jgi:Plasmid encoded RepA protein
MGRRKGEGKLTKAEELPLLKDIIGALQPTTDESPPPIPEEVAPPEAKPPSKRLISRINAAEEAQRLRNDNAQDVGYSAKPFIMCALPIKKPPKTVTHYERRNGNFTMSVVAHPNHGLPWGGYDRLVIIWLATRAVITDSRIVTFRSVMEVMVDLGLSTGGQQYKRFEEALDRVFYATFFIEENRGLVFEHEEYTFLREKAFRFIDSRQQLRRRHPGRRPANAENQIVLTEEIFSIIKRCQIPVDLTVVRELADAPGALDFYCWLVFRCFTVPEQRLQKIPLFGPYGLQLQLGVSDTLDERQFRRRIRDWLKLVKTYWPGCPAFVSEDGQHLVVTHGQAINDRNGKLITQ